MPPNKETRYEALRRAIINELEAQEDRPGGPIVGIERDGVVEVRGRVDIAKIAAACERVAYRFHSATRRG